MSRPFVFRQFSIRQDKAAFKVGTDSVLLGAWTTVLHGPSVLDIGTGTGILALMMAQRGAARILAIEPDPLSFAQATDNFMRSPWHDRLNCRQVSLQQLAAEKPDGYRLIVANPPYFRNHLPSADQRIQSARHDGQLTLEELSTGVASVLHPQGLFSVILPVNEFDLLEKLLSGRGIRLQRVCFVRSFAHTPVIRKMGEFGWNAGFPVNETLFLYDAVNKRSTAYQQLAHEFYLA